MHIWERKSSRPTHRYLDSCQHLHGAASKFSGYEAHYCTVEENSRVSELIKDKHAGISFDKSSKNLCHVNTSSSVTLYSLMHSKHPILEHMKWEQILSITWRYYSAWWIDFETKQLLSKVVWFYLLHQQYPCPLCLLNQTELLLEPWVPVRPESHCKINHCFPNTTTALVDELSDESKCVVLMSSFSPRSKFQWRQNIWTTSPTCSHQVPLPQGHHPSSSSSFSPFHPYHHPFGRKSTTHYFFQ